jgi:hypothetical protein
VYPDTTSSLTFFSSEMSEDGQSTVKQDLDASQGSNLAEDLRRKMLTQQPCLQHDALGKPMSQKPPSSLSSKPSMDEYHAFLRQQSQEHHKEVESMLRSLDSKVHESSQSTASKLKDLHKKLADVQLKQAKNLQQQEQQLKSSPRSSTLEIKNALLTGQQSKKQHDEISTMLAIIHAKVHQTSAHTSAQIQQLYKTLEPATLQQETIHNNAMGDVARQIQEQDRAQKAHLEAVIWQYLKQQVELEEQLKESQNLLQQVESNLQILTQKYQQLEGIAVTPAEAQQVFENVMARAVEMQQCGLLEQGKRKSTTATGKKGQQILKVNQELRSCQEWQTRRQTESIRKILWCSIWKGQKRGR